MKDLAVNDNMPTVSLALINLQITMPPHKSSDGQCTCTNDGPPTVVGLLKAHRGFLQQVEHKEIITPCQREQLVTTI